MNYLVSGIQQVGVGCSCFEQSWKWYIEMFQVDVRVLEDDTVAERMLPYTGGQAQKRHACIAMNLQGGGGFEIWQYSERTPVPCSFDVQAADLGTFAAKVKSRDPKALREQMLARYDKIGPLTRMPDGTECFFLQDPWGNYFQIVKDTYTYIDEHKLTGGVVGAMCGSKHIDQAVKMYQDIFGYDKVVYDTTGEFEDLKWLKGGEGRFRRVLLAHTADREGAFADLYGHSTVELVEALDREPRKLYEGRYWGDPGFIQLCFDVTNMSEIKKKCEAAGYPFTVDSCPNGERFDMGEASGHFTYIEDPDGTLIEMVEAHKLTILKRPHIYIDMLKRNRMKKFPKFFVRLMGLSRVKF